MCAHMCVRRVSVMNACSIAQQSVPVCQPPFDAEVVCAVRVIERVRRMDFARAETRTFMHVRMLRNDGLPT